MVHQIWMAVQATTPATMPIANGILPAQSAAPTKMSIAPKRQNLMTYMPMPTGKTMRGLTVSAQAIARVDAV